MKIDDEEKEARKFMAFILAQAINKKGITQRELANQLGLKSSAMNDIFIGKTTPSLMRTLKIFQALDLKIDDFLHKWELLNRK